MLFGAMDVCLPESPALELCVCVWLRETEGRDGERGSTRACRGVEKRAGQKVQRACSLACDTWQEGTDDETSV